MPIGIGDVSGDIIRDGLHLRNGTLVEAIKHGAGEAMASAGRQVPALVVLVALVIAFGYHEGKNQERNAARETVIMQVVKDNTEVIKSNAESMARVGECLTRCERAMGGGRLGMNE